MVVNYCKHNHIILIVIMVKDTVFVVVQMNTFSNNQNKAILLLKTIKKQCLSEGSANNIPSLLSTYSSSILAII